MNGGPASRPLWRRVVKGVLWLGAGAVALGFLALAVAYYRSDNICAQPRPTPGNPMNAIVYCDYGPPDVLKLETVEKPVPNDDQLLVKVKAAAINPLDWHY